MPERIVLDPAAVAVGRTELDISDWVGAAAGVDWGDAEITAYMAEGQRGSTPVDYRVPNRTITIPLVVKARGSVTFAQARERLQAKVALIQAEGGWLKRTTAAGGVVYCDLVNATLKLGGGWMQAHRDADPEGNLVLEAIPDFYGDEAAATETTVAAANSYTLPLPGIDGNYPARCRIVMTNNDSDEDTLTLPVGRPQPRTGRHRNRGAGAVGQRDGPRRRVGDRPRHPRRGGDLDHHRPVDAGGRRPGAADPLRHLPGVGAGRRPQQRHRRPAACGTWAT